MAFNRCAFESVRDSRAARLLVESGDTVRQDALGNLLIEVC
jgi:hypothetical protein